MMERTTILCKTKHRFPSLHIHIWRGAFYTATDNYEECRCMARRMRRIAAPDEWRPEIDYYWLLRVPVGVPKLWRIP